MSSNIFTANIEQLQKETEHLQPKSDGSNSNTPKIRKVDLSNNQNHNSANDQKSQLHHTNTSPNLGDKGGSSTRSSIDNMDDNQQESENEENAMDHKVSLLNDEDISQQKRDNLRKQELVRQSLDYKASLLYKEQQKLAKVNDELDAIENELAKDVEKLREMIDQLSRNIVFWEEDHNNKKKSLFGE